ncbi:hypothetical protein KUV85_12445 [Nocardioides panacisoli]|uniref:hypothetical protein n=1 Tax=Nocardioides panacisoli TaxID=627624 RepID=UPI001C62D361|nr:hypothetical protein [Nocardioides panacisoli]QYJ03141.1 hypothetical protein KUV85_12445 [Nocardioides panacisoli]
MTEEKLERVRVTAPRRRTSQAPYQRSRWGDVHEQTPLGGLYLRSLLREQLLLAGRMLGLLALTLGTIPLSFHLWPELADRRLLGLPVSWLLLGGVAYPLLVLLGWRYVRRVERNERDFLDLVRGSGPEPLDDDPPREGS